MNNTWWKTTQGINNTWWKQQQTVSTNKSQPLICGFGQKTLIFRATSNVTTEATIATYVTSESRKIYRVERFIEGKVYKKMNFIILIIGILVFLLNYNEGLLAARYGKKNYNTEEIRRTVKNSPSFFVGPRYGKRMAWSPGDDEFSSPMPRNTIEDLSCDYTGFSNYYRCSPRRYPDDEDGLSESD